MTKSVPFRVVFKVPCEIFEGMQVNFSDAPPSKITKIKSVKFIDMRTMEVIGLCKEINE
jgi:hypothetical protein